MTAPLTATPTSTTATSALLQLKGVRILSEETMNVPKSSTPRRRVRICEQSNQLHTIANDLTDDEHRQIWYNVQDFDLMKLNRRKMVKQQMVTIDNCNEKEDNCLRGLERLLPGGKQMIKRRHTAIKDIIKMHRQMQSLTPQDGDLSHEEREKVLAAFSASKTRYAQHTAKYMAAQDAAAVFQQEGNAAFMSSCKQTLQAAAKALANQQHKVATLNEVNDKQQRARRRVPMRAMTA